MSHLRHVYMLVEIKRIQLILTTKTKVCNQDNTGFFSYLKC